MLPITVFDKFPPHIQERYDFSNAQYTQALAPITGIVCFKHGVFKQYSAQLRKDGAGCPKCGEEARIQSRRMSHEEFVKRCGELHEGRYDYADTKYVNMTTKVHVMCRLHGAFPISPIKHLHGGQGCPVCGGQRRGQRADVLVSGRKTAESKVKKFAASFEKSAMAIHGESYEYSKVEYVDAKTKVAITCQKHGVFHQTPEHHLKRGYGCPQCGHIKSKQETRIADFLSIFTPVISRDRNVIKPKELDILLPEHNIAIEYCGMYWHSHMDGEAEKKDKHNHFQKYLLCASKGVRLLTIYEAEWNEREPAIRRLLRNAIGKSRGRLMARKCDMRKVASAEAQAFFEKYHPQGGAGSGEHYGLYWKDKLVACMRFSFGQNDRGAGAVNRAWTLARYVTRVTVVGAASRLFKAFLEDNSATEVKSFSDNRYFAGGMYEKLGFALESDTQPDYQVWSPKLGLSPKSHYQRRMLPKRLVEHGIEDVFDPLTDLRTEQEMTYLMGCGRIYDCGKKRWVWVLTPSNSGATV